MKRPLKSGREITPAAFLVVDGRRWRRLDENNCTFNKVGTKNSVQAAAESLLVL